MDEPWKTENTAYWHSNLRSNETQAAEPKESLDTKALVALFMEDGRLVRGMEAAIHQIRKDALLNLSPTSNLPPRRPNHHGHANFRSVLTVIGRRRTLSYQAKAGRTKSCLPKHKRVNLQVPIRGVHKYTRHNLEPRQQPQPASHAHDICLYG